MSICPNCNGTGYDVVAGWCDCDARPFEAGAIRNTEVGNPDTEPASRAEHARLLIIENSIYADTITAIDDLLEWSRHALGPVVALGQWVTYMERGWSPPVAARHILLALDHLDATLAELPPIVAELRTAALDELGEAAA